MTWKLFSMLLLAGAASTLPIDAACGCGGGSCGMAGGGGYGGGRAVASRKPLAGGASLAYGKSVAPALSVAALPARSATPVKTVADTKAKASAAKSPVYTCPMHPQVQWTKPTDCPICGMKLKLKQTKADAVKRGTPAADDHASMGMDEMSDMPGMAQDGMTGMDDMMMCPGCMMNTGGMSKMNGGKGAPAASQKASGTMAMAGMGCGC